MRKRENQLQDRTDRQTIKMDVMMIYLEETGLSQGSEVDDKIADGTGAARLLLALGIGKDAKGQVLRQEANAICFTRCGGAVRCVWKCSDSSRQWQ